MAQVDELHQAFIKEHAYLEVTWLATLLDLLLIRHVPERVSVHAHTQDETQQNQGGTED